jgi:hypothetical protein
MRLNQRAQRAPWNYLLHLFQKHRRVFLPYRSNPVVIASVRCVIVFRVSRSNLHTGTVESRKLNQRILNQSEHPTLKGNCMSRCFNCGASIDDCNESQPVCPRCGEPNGSFPIVLNSNNQTNQPDLLDRYRKDANGIRLVSSLRGQCLRCGVSNGGGSFRVCSNCGECWRVNHCLSCGDPVDSRDPETPRCPHCGWLACHTCGACGCETPRT